MKNLINLMIKTVLILVVLFLLIPVFGESTWTQTIITGIILSVLAYMIGDLWLLPKTGNLVAVIADLGITAFVLWAMMKALPQFTISSRGVWVMAVVVALVEWFFHLYLLATQAPGKKVQTP